MDLELSTGYKLVVHLRLIDKVVILEILELAVKFDQNNTLNVNKLYIYIYCALNNSGKVE